MTSSGVFAESVGDVRRWATRTVGALVDLVLPATCAGCGVGGAGQLCAGCAGSLAALEPDAAGPTPPPPWLPQCVAVGAYEGVLRSAILTYKERGAHRLAAPLGDHLARAIALAVRRAGLPVGTPIVIIPVPTTAAAVRDRHGDHMMRLGRRSVRALGRAGWPAALAKPLSARPKADSSHLGAHERAAAAAQAFRARPAHVRRVAEAARAGAVVIAVDDVLTTGSTMAALARVLHDAGAPVHGAATLAATRLRFVRVTPWKEAPDAVEPPPTRTFRPDRNPARRVGDSR